MARLIACALAALLFAAIARPASAAVKVCHPAIVGDEMKATREADARALALKSWSKLASLYGDAFASWRLAGGKAIACRRLADNRVHCQARGSPCTIAQTPPQPQPPPRTIPAPIAPKGEVRI